MAERKEQKISMTPGIGNKLMAVVGVPPVFSPKQMDRIRSRGSIKETKGTTQIHSFDADTLFQSLLEAGFTPHHAREEVNKIIGSKE